MAKKGHIGDRYRKVKISKEEVKKQNKKQYAKIAILALFLFVITLGGSYAIFTMTISGKKTTEVVSGTLTIEYLDKNEINLNNTYPMSNEEGLNTTPYTFIIKNTGTLNGKYTISIEEKDKNTLDKNYIKYAIREKDGEWSSPTLLSSGLVLKENVIIESGQEKTYELKMWLDENAPNEVQGKSYAGKIVVNTTQTNSNEITTTSPMIELNGEKVVTISENETYTDAGVNKIISSENLSIDNITRRYEYFDGTNTVEVESIDTSKIGSYYIYYEIEDSKDNIGITSRVVNVKKKDTNIPSIILKGESLISLEYNEEYIEAGYTASDEEDGNLTEKVVVIGTVNKEVSGTYVIKYIVIDSYGNTSSVTREVIVNEKSGTISVETTTEENENLTTEITIEAETENEKMYYTVTTSSEKPNDSEYQEMDLVTSLNNIKSISPSKLINTTEGKINKLGSLKKFRKVVEIVKNGTYYIYIKDEKENIERKSIKVTNIDETKPSCIFSQESYVGKNKTKEIILTCTDPADITTETMTKDYFEIGNTNIVDIEIGESIKIEKGYQYKINVLGKEAGTTNIKLLANKISDQVGNQNEEVKKEIKVTDVEVDSSEVKLDINGTNNYQISVTGTNEGSISYISSNEKIATVTTTGLITGVSPGTTTIIVEEGNGKVQKEISVTVVKTLTVIYEKQGSGITGIGSTKATCEVTNENGTCSVILPSIIVAEEYEAGGWYNGTTKVGNATEEYLVSYDITLTAKARDTTAPSKPTLTNSSNENWAKSATVTITSTDAGSGIDHYEWYENGNWTTRAITVNNGVGTITYTAERNLTIRFRTVDVEGNISEEATTTLKIDTTAPSCSWTRATVNYNETTTLKLTCTDSASGIVSKSLTTSNFIVSDTTYGSVTAVSSASAVTNGYEYTVTVKGVAAGSFTLSLNAGVISDNAGNINAKTTSGSITVNKVSATNPSLTAYSGTYDGTSHSITVSGGSGGTIEYSTDNATWSTTKPTRTNAGTTTVYVRVLGDSNHNTTTSISSTITIAKATPTLTLSATSGTVVAGKTMTFIEKSSVAGSFSNTSGTTSVATISPASVTASANTAYTETITGVAGGSSTITIVFTPSDTTNYNSVTKTYAATITKSATIPTNSLCVARTYTGSAQQLTSATSGTGYTLSGYSQTTANTYTITATLASGYRWSDNATGTKTFQCTLSKATPTITLSATSGTVVAGKTMTFTEKSSVAGSFSNTSGTTSVATISPASVTASANTAYTETITGVASGSSTITVKFTPSDTTNYNSVTKTYAATITKSATIPTNSLCVARTYTGSAQQLTSATSGTGYTLSGYSQTTANTYTITATLTSGYRWSDNATGTKTFQCTLSKATPTLTQSATSGSATTANTTSYTIKSNVAGTYSASSANTSYATVSLSSTSTIAANSAVTATVKAVSVNSSAITITVKFTPSDTTNYNSTSKTYSFTPKARTYTITYSKGTGVSAIGSTSATFTTVGSATSCTFTSSSSTTCTPTSGNLPSITASSGYTVAGWYNGTTKVGDSSAKFYSISGFTISSNITLTAIAVKTTTTFSYTGGQQTYTAPVTGTYKLEVWGAQGGSSLGVGGYGGFASGLKAINASSTLYITVGGQPSDSTGGYNGGGAGSASYSSGGGGATHIATQKGTLSSLGSKTNLLIAAGGGGGGAMFIVSMTGGTGGGSSGGAGKYYTYDGNSGTLNTPGGSQTSGNTYVAEKYISNAAVTGPSGMVMIYNTSSTYQYGLVGYIPGSFGKGGGGTVGGGGGGGLYGGTAFWGNSAVTSGGGGSSYIGGVTSGSTSSGQRSGNGYARITFVSAS